MAASSDDRNNERAGGGSEEPEERTDGWMTSYADMVTLLMTFFVLMFALSNADTEKATLFMAAMSRDGLTAEQFMEIQERFDPDLFIVDEWDDLFLAPDVDEEDGSDEDEGESEGERALRELAESLEQYIDIEGIGEDISVAFNGDFLMLTLSNDVWFDSGQAYVRPEMVSRAEVIAQLLADNFHVAEPFEIVVAGHTDNVPMFSREFPSNWHLSAGRALNFVELLIDDSGLDPWHFYTRACGEYRPIATNNTPEGRQANRRVEVMITRARDNPLWDGQFRSD